MVAIERSERPAAFPAVVDGAIVVPGAAHDLLLHSGPHHIRFQAPNYVPREVDVQVPNGGSVAVDCTLERLTTTATIGPVVPSLDLGAKGRPEEAKPSPWYGRWYTWAGAGVVVVGATVLSILVIGASSKPVPSTDGGSHHFP